MISPITLIYRNTKLKCHFLVYSSHRRAFSEPLTITTTVTSKSIRSISEVAFLGSLIYRELGNISNYTNLQLNENKMPFLVYSSHLTRIFTTLCSTATETNEHSFDARSQVPKVRFKNGASEHLQLHISRGK